VPDFESTVAGLRRWTAHHDLHVRAAVDLLIWHETWIRRPDFTRACVRKNRDGTTYIDWDAAREFADAPATASTSEMAVLDLAVCLAADRFRLSRMGSAHSKAIVRAFAAALDEEEMLHG
jgi:hypothetical protein